MPDVAPQKSLDDRDLWNLYKITLDERNFQVNLNWDRTKHYFLLNFAAFGAVGALKELGALEQSLLFVLVILNALFAAYSIKRGHEYYRETRTRLLFIQRQLGILKEDPAASPLATKTTRGMVREAFHRKATFSDRMTTVRLAIWLQYYIALAAAIAVTHPLWYPLWLRIVR